MYYNSNLNLLNGMVNKKISLMNSVSRSGHRKSFDSAFSTYIL
jgi:hypothetical protein